MEMLSGSHQVDAGRRISCDRVGDTGSADATTAAAAGTAAAAYADTIIAAAAVTAAATNAATSSTLAAPSTKTVAYTRVAHGK